MVSGNQNHGPVVGGMGICEAIFYAEPQTVLALFVHGANLRTQYATWDLIFLSTETNLLWE